MLFISTNGRSHSLLVVVDGGGHAAVGLGNAYYTVVYVVGVARHSVCPVGNADKVVISIIRIGYGSIIGVNNLREISYRVVLVANHLAVGVGVARYTVERIVGSCDCAVAINDSQDVSAHIIRIADRALGGLIACNSAHGVIEDLADLTVRKKQPHPKVRLNIVYKCF